jgi:uncharacterized DUF497 family protein
VWIVSLEIDDQILDKIVVKRAVSFQEVEEACYGPHVGRRGRDGVSLLYGRSAAGRYLVVVLAPRGRGVWVVVTARDMTPSERRGFHGAGGI